MVEQIQGKRQSKVKVDFEKVVSPFASFVQEDVNATPILKPVRQEAKFSLDAIVNDKALINNHWVRVGDVLEGYRVESIAEDHVVLKKANRSVEVFLPKPKKILQFQITEG
ncbi:hypothetical protein [Nitratifractor salsuginis]|nr:hypothetical protein [Nitratifractor salsuginis]